MATIALTPPLYNPTKHPNHLSFLLLYYKNFNLSNKKNSGISAAIYYSSTPSLVQDSDLWAYPLLPVILLATNVMFGNLELPYPYSKYV